MTPAILALWATCIAAGLPAVARDGMLLVRLRPCDRALYATRAGDGDVARLVEYLHVTRRVEAGVA